MFAAILYGSLFVVNCAVSFVVCCVPCVVLCLYFVGWYCVLWMMYASVVVVCRVLSVAVVCCVLSYGVTAVVVRCCFRF